MTCPVPAPDTEDMSTSTSQRAPGRGRRWLLVLTAAAAVALIVGAARPAREFAFDSCPADVVAPLAPLRPHRAGDLDLTKQGQGCTRRVATSRSGDAVVAHYRSELEAHHWQMRVKSQRDLEGQCSSGPGQCRALYAFGDGVCFALNTDTVPLEQALTADRTTLFFFAAPCKGIADYGRLN